MTPGNSNKRTELAEGKSPAVLTGLLIILVLYVAYIGKTQQSGEFWIQSQVFQVTKILGLLNEKHYNDFLSMLFYSNFCTINIWQSIFSAYFFFTFGVEVERRLGPSRFISLVVLGSTLPWIVQFFDILRFPIWPLPFEYPKIDTYFFGPAFILFTLLSAYWALVPRKKSRELYIIQSDKSRSTKLSRQNASESINKRFGFAPELYMSAFVVYEVVQRGFIIYPWKNLDTMGLYASITAMLIGWILCNVILTGVKENLTDHPLKHEAIDRYYELLDLDVSSENAIRGAAKAMGLPDDQVRNWVVASKGKLRTKK